MIGRVSGLIFPALPREALLKRTFLSLNLNEDHEKADQTDQADQSVLFTIVKKTLKFSKKFKIYVF